jgi:Sporulation and spore germination
MTVRVLFHEQAPAPESDPRRVVPVSRTVPRSPKVATAALNELLRGPTARERAAGYWSFFSDDTARMLRGARVTGGTGFADFRDFRRLLPNATSSYGSTALLAELDATLKQFPTIKGTLYAFNGDVAAFYTWLQLGPPSMPTGAWRSIAPAPIAGRDGAAAVWTGRQLLVWGGHGRSGYQGLRPLRDGAAYDPAGDRWSPIPTAPAGVQGTSAAAAWTGSRMLVWLGNAPDGPAVGATYDPARRSWRRIAPSPIGARESFSTVWTGYELIVFGGSSGDGLATPVGAAYDPVSDRWRVLPAAPMAARLDHAAAWTGREMLIWGGRDTRGSFADGAAYDPRADRWRPIAGRPASAVAASAWTRTRMLIWDGPSGTGGTTGALYDPVRDRWSSIARGPALGANHSGPVWTGSQLVAWNGGAGTGAIAYTRRPTAGPPCRLGRSPVLIARARRWSGPAARW